MVNLIEVIGQKMEENANKQQKGEKIYLSFVPRFSSPAVLYIWSPH